MSYYGRSDAGSGIGETFLVLLMFAIVTVVTLAVLATVMTGEPFAALDADTYLCLFENGYMPKCVTH